MAEMDDILDPRIYNRDYDEDLCTEESSWTNSHGILKGWGRPTDLYDLSDEEQTEKQEWSVGPIYLICLTIGTGGLQVIWTAIMGHGSLYLSSLGLPPSVISFIWLAGPISGTVVQPYVSVLSDNSNHPWGQRKPYILFGTIFTIIFMLLLPWTGDSITYFSTTFGYDYYGTTALIAKGVVSVLLIWALNIAIQPVQMGIRALIYEACPLQQKVQATAYASCITGIGSVFGYAAGFTDLSLLLPWFGDTQFKCLSVVASCSLALTTAVTLSLIREQKAMSNNEVIKSRVRVINVFRQVYRSMIYMPQDAKRVCQVQFFAWVGWFPFLFYITTYVSGLYEKDLFGDPMENATSQFLSPPHSDSVRYGNFAMVLFAIVALLSSIILPFIVSASTQNSSTQIIRLSRIPTTLCNAMNNRGGNITAEGDHLRRSLQSSRISRLIASLKVPWLTLPRTWAASHILMSTVVFSTYLTYSPILSTCLASMLGISWAVTQWAPLALISVSIATQEELKQATPSRRSNCNRINTLSGEDYGVQSPTYSDNSSDEDVGNGKEWMSGVVEDLQAGAAMGIYNIAIAAPQIVAAIGGSGILWLLRWNGFDDTNAVGWVIRIGGLAGLVAAWLALGIKA